MKNVNLNTGGVLAALAGLVGGAALGISLGLENVAGIALSGVICGAYLGNKIWDSVFGKRDTG